MPRPYRQAIHKEDHPLTVTSKDNIIVYSLLDCIHCDRMKANLDKLGYQYTTVSNIDVLTVKDIPLVPALEINGRLLQHREALDWVEDRLGETLGPDEPLLTRAFLRRYPDFPPHMTPLGMFTYYRTYSRFLHELGRRETWKETVARAVEYNVGLDRTHRVKNRLPVPEKWLREEAQNLFDAIFNLKMFCSGRTLWVAGTQAARKFPMSNFNCSFTNVEKWADLPEIFYLLMLGSGVGFKSTKEMAAQMPPIRINTTLIVSPYRPVPVEERLENTSLRTLDNGYAKIYVGDSKEGWRDALDAYLKILTEERYEYIHTVKVSFNSVRPSGERLMTFGGTASGPEPLMEMFLGIDKVLKNQIDPTLAPIQPDEKGYGRVRPIHILDIENLIGNNVVSGGVRRTASIFLFDADDYESLFAKYGMYGLWSEEQFQQHEKVQAELQRLGIPIPGFFEALGTRRYDPAVNGQEPFSPMRPGLQHRQMSNNSIAFTQKPSDDFLHFIFMMMRNEGEPGFINMEAGAKRRANMQGINPCAEILLDSKQQCNLSTINLAGLINDEGVFDQDSLEEAQRMQELSVRTGIRMTLVDLELPEWDANNKRDRLTGCSMTGIEDAFSKLSKQQRAQALNTLRKTAVHVGMQYASDLRIVTPLLTTTIKPEGSLSLVAGGVSPGLHDAHSPYHIRRIRISKDDALAKVAVELGWHIEEDQANNRTLVIDFPMKSNASRTKDDVSALEQVERYLMFQREYTQHNSSNTITIKPDEWDQVEGIIREVWDEFVGVSFLSHSGGNYVQAPYQSVSKEAYESLAASMKPFDPAVLAKYEGGEDHVLDDNDPTCATGSCPVR